MMHIGARIGMWLAIICLCSGWTGIADGGDTAPEFLTLEDAVCLALHENPEMTVAASRVNMAEEKVIQARAGFFPQLNAIQSYNRTTDPMWAFGTRLNQERIEPADFNPDKLNDPDPIGNYKSSLSLVWPIFDSGGTWYGWQQARDANSAADRMQQRTRRQIAAAATEAYLGLLLARKQCTLIEKTLETAQAHRQITQSRLDQGTAVKSDLLLAEVRIAEVTQQRLAARSRVEIAHSYLNAAMGVAEDIRYEPVSPLDAGEPIEGDAAHWVKLAIESRADIEHLAYQESIAEAEVRKRRAAHLPSLNLVGNYDVNTERFDDYGKNYTVGAVVQFNLFSGARLSSRTREARAALAEIRSRRKQIETGVRVEAREAFLLCRSTWQQIAVAEAAVAQATEALRIVENRYRSGLATVVDLLNAETARYAAATRHFAATHDYRVAAVRLKLAAGTL